VSLVLAGSPDRAASASAEQAGIEPICVRANTWRYEGRTIKALLSNRPPQVVHMHDFYIPKQASLALQLKRSGIPYIVTPHGGLHRESKWLKKSVYIRLVERARLYRSSAITAISPQEEEIVRAVVPNYKGVVRRISNPVETSPLSGFSWKRNTGAKRLVFLGRFHVIHKGIDILVEIARLLPSVEVHLYGILDHRTKRSFERLQRRLPPNVQFRDPVFGAEKARVLSEASLYVQMSRWEVAGISIAEAMYLGVPCAISSASDLADPFLERDLGLVLPLSAEEAARRLSEALDQQDRLDHWSKRGRSFARENFDPHMVASSYLKLYEEILRA
jgi:glycosyltransferase involved in cell wall biosynthesis